MVTCLVPGCADPADQVFAVSIELPVITPDEDILPEIPNLKVWLDLCTSHLLYVNAAVEYDTDVALVRIVSRIGTCL